MSKNRKKRLIGEVVEKGVKVYQVPREDLHVTPKQKRDAEGKASMKEHEQSQKALREEVKAAKQQARAAEERVKARKKETQEWRFDAVAYSEPGVHGELQGKNESGLRMPDLEKRQMRGHIKEMFLNKVNQIEEVLKMVLSDVPEL